MVLSQNDKRSTDGDIYQPQDEKDAIEYFNRVGREEVMRQFNEVCEIGESRMNDAMKGCHSLLFRYSAIDFLNDNEKSLRHKLLLGMTLCINERQEASERLKQRIEARKASRQYRQKEIKT